MGGNELRGNPKKPAVKLPWFLIIIRVPKSKRAVEALFHVSLIPRNDNVDGDFRDKSHNPGERRRATRATFDSSAIADEYPPSRSI